MQQFEGRKDLNNANDLVARQQKRERYQEIVKDSICELYGNASFWDFFKSFNEESVHDFIIEYASKKAWYLVNGDRILTNRDHEEFRYRDMAENCFWEIQQKKLFNMQSEWRAGLIQIDEIETTKDFHTWEKSIATCPFLAPVSKLEFEMYVEYILMGEYKEKTWLYNWQDYEMYRNQNTGNDFLPAWYRYYDMKMGTGYLQLLPDKKGVEEKQYFDAWQEKHLTNGTAQISDEDMVSGPLPNLHLTYETLDFFIKTFENKALLKYFQAAENRPEDAAKEEELEEALRILRRAPAGIQLPKAADWRTSVIDGAREFKHQQILVNLPNVYDDYLFRIKTGIAFNNTDPEGLYSEFLDSANIYKAKLEEGKSWLERESI